MKRLRVSVFLGCVAAVIPALSAQVSRQELQSISTPDKVETHLGTLEFHDGAPTPATVQKLYDNLDFTHAFDAFENTFQGVSTEAAHRGFLSIGCKDNEFLIYSNFTDSKSLFLTANADTMYVLSFIDLSKGPMVLEAPAGLLGVIDDAWFNWVIDVGASGPDRGKGGKYLLVPPGYNGPLPSGGYYIAYSQTYRVGLLGRGFIQKDGPAATVDLIKKTTKLYPYEPGGEGTSVADILTGKYPLALPGPGKPAIFHEGSGVVFNTIPPNDSSYYEMLNDQVQREPATSLGAELMGPIAAIGIVKGKPFAPDARMKKILTEAAAVGNATSRSLAFNPREAEGWSYYPNSTWGTTMWTGGYNFETPPPLFTSDGIKPLPATGARTLDSRSAFFYVATGITPAMIMRIPGVGSQYLATALDSQHHYLDGAKTYKVVLPKGIPQAKFWSLTIYDMQTRSMLQTSQQYPRAGSQNFPVPAAVADADGSTTVYFSPKLPAGVNPANWLETVPGKGWFTILRLYSPTTPFFNKTWRIGEIEPVK